MLSNQPIPKRGRKFHFRTAVRAVVMNQPIPTRGRKPLKTNLSDGELWEPTHPQAGTKIFRLVHIRQALMRTNPSPSGDEYPVSSHILKASKANQPIPTRGRKFIANNCIILYTRTNPSPLGDENRHGAVSLRHSSQTNPSPLGDENFLPSGILATIKDEPTHPQAGTKISGTVF